MLLELPLCRCHRREPPQCVFSCRYAPNPLIHFSFISHFSALMPGLGAQVGLALIFCGFAPNRFAVSHAGKIALHLMLAARRVVGLASVAFCRALQNHFAQTQKIYQKAMMLT